MEMKRQQLETTLAATSIAWLNILLNCWHSSCIVVDGKVESGESGNVK